MTRCQLLLSLLEDAGERGVTTSEILQAGVGSRYGARLMELRKQGHRITSERVREGSWRYVLITEEPAPSPDEMNDIEWDAIGGAVLKLFESAA